MPKSSIEIRTPSAESRSSTVFVRARSAEHRRLGDLELEQGRREARVRQQPLDLVGELDVEQVARRQVHRHGQLEPAVPPLAALAHGLSST